jgi:hypothetical protein
MTIYAIDNILSSKSHNPHYLKRYIRFIESCQTLNEDYVGYTEKHHICPQSKDLFPEYKSFYKNPWNCAILTPRQHFIAHHLLWKAYPEMKSTRRAFFLMSHRDGNKLDARTYAILSEENSKNSSESALKRVADKTHHLLGGEIARESALKRVADKTHHLLGGEIQRKRVADKTHHLLGSVPCYDKQGTSIRVPKEIYHSQTGQIEDREYVHFRTKEGKRRQQIESSSL